MWVSSRADYPEVIYNVCVWEWAQSWFYYLKGLCLSIRELLFRAQFIKCSCPAFPEKRSFSTVIFSTNVYLLLMHTLHPCSWTAWERLNVPLEGTSSLQAPVMLLEQQSTWSDLVSLKDSACLELIQRDSSRWRWRDRWSHNIVWTLWLWSW